MKTKIRVTRIEEDNDLTNLLSTRKKYQIEYNLNLRFQGFGFLQTMIGLAPLMFAHAIADRCIGIASKELKEKGLIS
jgi:hypothetical protein